MPEAQAPTVQFGAVTAQAKSWLPYVAELSYTFAPGPSMRMAPKLPVLLPVVSYFMVMMAPLAEASTVACVTDHGTMPAPPPNDTLSAAAAALTPFDEIPTMRMNANV